MLKDSQREFIQVACHVLVRREGIGQDVAKSIAIQLSYYSTDVRDAVRIGRLSHGDQNKVLEAINTLFPNGRSAPVKPVGDAHQ